MTEALDYVAQGKQGMNFHDARATLVRVYPYAELRAGRARRRPPASIARGIGPGDRVALIAETAAEFVALFFGALYAGAWPVPLPLPTSFGGKDAYIDQLAVQLKSADPALLLYPPELHHGRRRRRGRRRRGAIDWATLLRRGGRRAAARPRPGPTTSPICNIRAARPASRTAS